MALELSVLFAFGAMLSWGIGDFLIQKTTRKIGDIETLAFIGIIGSIVLLPFVFGQIHLIFSPENALLFFLLGALAFFVAVFNFEALKQGKLSVIDVILEIELPVTVILAFLFFRETFSFPQLFLMLLVFLGIVLISAESLSIKKHRLIEKGVFLALITAIGMGFVNFLTASASRHASPLLAIWVPWLIVSIISVFFIWRREGLQKFFKNGLRFKKLVVAVGLIDTLAWLFFAFAVSQAHLSITTAITESYPAIAMFLGIWLNKEKILPHQFAGAGIALIGSVALGFIV